MQIERQDSFKITQQSRVQTSRYYITGDSDAAHALRHMAALGADCDSPLLILGPHGSGKEHVARHIHGASIRRRKPFLKLNCGLENLALHSAQGCEGLKTDCSENIETANGGTLYLADADEMSLDVQTLVLQLIEQRSLGGLDCRGRKPLDISVIASSSRCLASMVSEGTFRQDLYYRLNMLSLHVPPLRQRREDIVPLMQQFLHEKEKAQRFSIDWAAGQALRTHNWPGNIRELHNLVTRACGIYPGQIIGARQMSSLLAAGRTQSSGKTQNAADLAIAGPLNTGFKLKDHLDAEEAQILTAALTQANGIVQHAADLSGLKRTTFIEKMRRHGINRLQFRRL